MPRFAGSIEAREPAKLAVRGRRVEYVRRPSLAELKRRSSLARLRWKAKLADDPANWVTLTGLSDDEVIAILRRR